MAPKGRILMYAISTAWSWSIISESEMDGWGLSAELCRLISGGRLSNNTCTRLIHQAPAYHFDPRHSITVACIAMVRAYHLSICIPGGRGDRGRIKSRAGFCGRAADAKLVLMHNSGGRGGEEALSVLFPCKQTYLQKKLICRPIWLRTTRPGISCFCPSSSHHKKIIMQDTWFVTF